MPVKPNLDDLPTIEKVDASGMRTRIAELPDQIQKGVEVFSGVSIPTHYVQARHIVVLGMGGSAIGGELAATLAASDNPLPVEIRRDYDVPGYVNKNSLVIGVSFSGNTEETISGFRAAAAKGAKLLAVTTGGELASLGRKFQIPIFAFEYQSLPREAVGFLLTAILIIFQKLRFSTIDVQDLLESAVLMRALGGKLEPSVPTHVNLAKALALKIKDRIPLIMGAGAMSVVARRWKTQFNENSKLAALADSLPELCHNTNVGLGREWKQRDTLLPIFLTSVFAQPRNQLRMNIISRILNTQRLSAEQVVIHPAGTLTSEAIQMIMLGDYVSYYLAILGGIDPTPVNAIDELKKELSQHSMA